VIEAVGKLLLDPLTGRWRSSAIGSCLLFWLALVVIYLRTRHTTPGGPPFSTCRAGDRLLWCEATASKTVRPVLGALGALAVLVASANAIASAAPSLVSAILGESWPARAPLRWVGTLLAAARERHIGYLGDRFDTLHRRAKAGENVTAAQSAVVRRLVRYAPGLPARPTAAGNLHAALKARAERSLGLDLDVVLPVLVEVVPGEFRSRLKAESLVVLLRAQQLAYGLLAAPLGAALLLSRSWPAALVWIVCLLLLCAVLQNRVVAALASYSDSLWLALLVHRSHVYTALGETAPSAAENERLRGKQLSDGLWRLWRRTRSS
jgi:hypothetical protein